MAAYHEYVGAVERAAQLGNAAEDLTSGESRIGGPAARKLQEQFASLAVDSWMCCATCCAPARSLRSGRWRRP